MFEQLKAVEKRFDELTQRLSEPTVLSDQPLYRKLAQEHAHLKRLVEVYRQYQKNKRDLEQNRRLLAEEKDEVLCEMAREELLQLEEEKSKQAAELQMLLLPPDPNDEKNILLEIRAGTGGEEAALFASDLFRMYQRYAEVNKWNVEILEQSSTGRNGLKELIALISGKSVYSKLKYESGVHRVQRVPETEASGRIHTSAVTVAVLPEAEEIDVTIEDKDLRIDVFRASGPGGQGVNRTDSAVRLTHLPSGIVVACQDERSQHKNKARAMKILRSKLLDMEQQKQEAERSATRKSQVGTGDRSEKIRTYNFPQNRVTDHRIGYTIHNLSVVMGGDIEELITKLRTYFQTEQLKESASAL